MNTLTNLLGWTGNNCLESDKEKERKREREREREREGQLGWKYLQDDTPAAYSIYSHSLPFRDIPYWLFFYFQTFLLALNYAHDYYNKRSRAGTLQKVRHTIQNAGALDQKAGISGWKTLNLPLPNWAMACPRDQKPFHLLKDVLIAMIYVGNHVDDV